MAQVTIPNRPAGTDQRSIEAILANFDAITAVINGNIDNTNISAALAQSAAVNQSGQTVKGAVNIPGTETRTNVAYGTMPTPDQVTVVLPTNGLLALLYQATWQESVAGTAQAAIFIGPNQVQVQGNNGSTRGPHAQSAATNSATAAINLPLISSPVGLLTVTDAIGFNGDVTTGQIIGYDAISGNLEASIGTNHSINPSLGGPCYMFAAAGTHTISVQFKSSSGSVTASNRKLWVQALSFS